MKKINENTKVTLTLEQLKKLVKEKHHDLFASAKFRKDEIGSKENNDRMIAALQRLETAYADVNDAWHGTNLNELLDFGDSERYPFFVASFDELGLYEFIDDAIKALTKENEKYDSSSSM